MSVTLKLLVDGGKASAGPPIGPTLAPLKMPIQDIVNAINEKTKGFAGIQVPVTLVANTVTKEFTLDIGTPPVSSLIKKEMKLDKLAIAPFGTYKPKEGEQVKEFDQSIEVGKLIEITKSKMDTIGTSNLKNALKCVVASCVSTGMKVEGKHPKEILKEIDSGVWDSKLKA